MNQVQLEFLPSDFVRYVYAGCVELGNRLGEEPQLAQQIEDVIREQVSRTPLEAMDIETGLAILAGPDIAKAVMGCLRFLETHQELTELETVGFDRSVVRLLRYLVARYGPVLKSVRRRTNHPLGWHKFGHMVTKLETGATHLHIKLVRNDDTVLLLEDDSDSIMRLINFMLKSLEQVDDYQTIDDQTVREFIANYGQFIEKTGQTGTLGGGNKTEH